MKRNLNVLVVMLFISITTSFSQNSIVDDMWNNQQNGATNQGIIDLLNNNSQPINNNNYNYNNSLDNNLNTDHYKNNYIQDKVIENRIIDYNSTDYINSTLPSTIIIDKQGNGTIYSPTGTSTILNQGNGQYIYYPEKR